MLMSELKVRVTLRWAEHPKDLALHMWDSHGKHCFSNYKNAGPMSLDNDVTQGFGPETISISSAEPNTTYYVSVHHYSGTSTLWSSQAVLKIVGIEGLNELVVPVAPVEYSAFQGYWRCFSFTTSQAKPVTVTSFDVNSRVLVDQKGSDGKGGWDSEARLRAEAKAKAEEEARLQAKAAAKAKAEAAASKSAALNDNALGIDRLGYQLYAQALVTMLKEADTPVSVGIFASWGSGKSFIIALIKKLFDPKARENATTHQLVQKHEVGYNELSKTFREEQEAEEKEEEEEDESDENDGLLKRCQYRLDIILGMIGLLMTFSYTLQILYFILVQALKDKSSLAVHFWAGKKVKSKDDADAGNVNKMEKGHTKAEKDYLFVDFNAWLFAGNGHDLLWVGLVRELYRQAELRIASEKIDINGEPCDFKTEWRVKKAVRELEKKFGGRSAVLCRALMLVFLAALLLLVIMSEALGVSHVLESAGKSVASASAFVASLGALMVAAVPPVQMALRAGKEGNTSRGESLFERSSSVRDQLGFMDYVKKELEELFEFLHEFEERTNKKLVFVLFIDDLDRCLNGQNVKVLEAVTLMLSVPGAPIIAFLAIDLRLVVASIDHVFRQSMELEKTNVSGQEYMDKVVQLPMALPSPSKEKVKRLIEKSLEGLAATPEEVRRRLMAYREVIEKLMDDAPKEEDIIVRFNDASSDDTDKDKQKQQHKVVRAADFLELTLSPADDNSKFVIDVVKMLMPDLASAVGLGEEGVEIMCRALNSILRSVDCFSVESKDLVDDQTLSKKKDDDSLYEAEKDETPKPEKEVKVKKEEQMLPFGSKDIRAKIKSMSVDFKEAPLLVPQECIGVFSSLRHVIDGNPRRVKRIINVFQVAYNLAKLWPLNKDEPNGEKMVDDLERWPLFVSKLILWICLCEMFPYRMSFLVLIIEDNRQKAKLNDVTSEQKKEQDFFRYYSTSIEAEENRDAAEAKKEKPKLQLTEKIKESEPIAVVFPKHVEQRLYFDGYERFSVLDSDPEVFYLLLSTAVPSCGQNKEPVYIKVGDIFGLEDDSDSVFSLLRFSINLPPTIRDQISSENFGFVSTSELKLVIEQDGKEDVKVALPKKSLMRKQRHLRDNTPNRFRPLQSSFSALEPEDSGCGSGGGTSF